MTTLFLKRRHNMMTLQLKRCVSLFVCLSLLLSACSPDKSHKAGSNVSDITTRTSVLPQRVDRRSCCDVANIATSFLCSS
ncbi:MAG: hypothetical protein LE180_01435, partial [Endomicrobium sp.]|uniref:hypothetical protein n=1 Tax=Candidatus Endomicrobiellum pyrsonymphae TaxID=1408203 RepID=UPI00358BFE52|nr:hypothetical protein [Endomicrobium sp.]